MFIANVYVTLKEGVLALQGDAVKNSSHVLGYGGVAEVRGGSTVGGGY